MQDLGSVLLAQLTAVRDEQPALVSCLAFGRAWYHGVDLGGRSLADLVAGSSTVTDRKEPAHYTCQKHAKQVCLSMHKNSQKRPQQHVRPNFQVANLRPYFVLTAGNECRHEVGAEGASPLTSRPSSASSPSIN